MDKPDERNIEKQNLMAGLHWAATVPPCIKDHILKLLKVAALLKTTNANYYQKKYNICISY